MENQEQSAVDERYNHERIISFHVNGRKVTLAPIRSKILTTELREVESTVPCGIRHSWLSGKDEDGNELTADMCVFGWISFQYKGKNFCINVEDICNEVMELVNETEEHNAD